MDQKTGTKKQPLDALLRGRGLVFWKLWAAVQIDNNAGAGSGWLLKRDPKTTASWCKFLKCPWLDRGVAPT